MPDARHSVLQNGVTLFELVVVLSVISIVSAVAIPRLTNTDNQLIAQADKLAQDIRHVQAIAMSQGRTLVIDVESAGSYKVVSGGSTITDPATRQPFVVTLNGNVTLNGIDTAIDSMGRPVDAGKLLTGTRKFTLSGGSRVLTVSVTPVTGFVEVMP